MAKYTIVLKQTNGDIYELLPKSWSFTDELNAASTANFYIGFEDIKNIADIYETDILSMFTASFREIWIERDGSKVFWGAITDFEVSNNKEGDRTINVKATDWFGLLGKRICGVPVRTFSATDAGTIAWTLISESQSYDAPYSSLGITQGSITASKNRDRTYRFDNIKESIERLSNTNLNDGFDFDIDMTKAFNVYYPTKGSDRPNIVFNSENLADYLYKKPLLMELCNIVYVLGEGNNDDLLYAIRTANTSYRTDWKTLEAVLSERDIKELTTLQDKGDAYLNDYQSPNPELTIKHYDDKILFTDYNIGDTIRVNIPELGFDNTSKRVIRRQFSMEQEKSMGFMAVDLL